MPAHKSSVSQLPDVFSQYFEPVEAQMQLVGRRLRQNVSTGHKEIDRRLVCAGAGGGKLLRPAITLLAGRVCGRLYRRHIELAAMIELVHAATLLHDDIIDGAQIRRGEPTANMLWGNTAAVLMGDFLLSRAFLCGAGLEIPTAAAVLSRTAERICRGELLQNLRRGCWQMGRAEYMRIIEEKTAGLFAAGCYLAGLAGGMGKGVSSRLREYGRCVGLAFQITDDILDITGDSAGVGKTLRTDIALGKPTLPVIHFLRQAGCDGRAGVDELVNKLRGGRAALVLQRSGSLEYARKQAAVFADRAVAALDSLPPCRAGESLKRLAVAIGRRA